MGGTPGVGIGENLPDKGNDTDGDNVPDDVEIAMGTDPLNPSSFALPEVGVATFTVEEEEHTFLYFTFQKTTNGTLDHFIIEQSRDLKNWESADADLVLMSEEKLENGISLVQYRGALPFDNQEKDGSFMRLRVIAD
ncbi:MAG: thrombospondin type 3 repeat-containing protein [Akkermansiaceae bacterium]